MRLLAIPAVTAALLLAGCADEGLSTEEIREAAMERVRGTAGITEQSAKFTDIFVGESEDGETVVCGRIAGTRGDGATLPTVRFIAGVDPDRWVLFEPTTGLGLPSEPEKFIEWRTACLGERTVPR